MPVSEHWNFSEELKNRYTAALTDNLPALRGKLGISQGDLARCVGISRQTYCAVEGKQRRMSWDTFLALSFFFDNNRSTHEMLRSVGAYPRELIERYNEGLKELCGSKAILCENTISELIRVLDDHAIHALKTVLLLEYARCAGISGGDVLRSFDGKNIKLKTVKDKKT